MSAISILLDYTAFVNENSTFFHFQQFRTRLPGIPYPLYPNPILFYRFSKKIPAAERSGEKSDL